VTVTLPATTARLRDLPVDLAPAEIRLESGRVTTGPLTLRAGEAALALSGTADLAARTIDARGQGTVELRALSAFLQEAALTGASEIDLRVQGPFDAPRATGTVRLRDATLRARALPQALTDIGAELTLDGDSLTLRDTTARLGGGTIAAQGTARLSGTGLADAAFTFTGRDLGLRYPEGMRSRLDADLTLTGATGAFRLAGTVLARRGLYELDTAMTGALMAPEPQPLVSPFLRSVALDIRVQTESPVHVRSAMVRRLQATGRLTVRGDLETPAPVGTLDVEPGGTVALQGREFAIGSGRLAYTGNWDPDLSVRASARIPDMDQKAGTTRGDVDVTVAVEGQLMKPRLSLSSDPSRSQMEIASLITTGDSQNPNARLAVGGPGRLAAGGPRLAQPVRPGDRPDQHPAGAGGQGRHGAAGRALHLRTEADQPGQLRLLGQPAGRREHLRGAAGHAGARRGPESPADLGGRVHLRRRAALPLRRHADGARAP
jgi:translocation and assembly module TamB